MSKSSAITTEEKTKLFSVRFLISLLLVVAGIAWLAFYYIQARGNPLAFPPVEGSPKAVADLGDWNYVIGFGLLMLGLMVSAHPSTPLGRGRGVVVGMLACFLIGLAVDLHLLRLLQRPLQHLALQRPRPVEPRRRHRVHGGRVQLRDQVGVGSPSARDHAW